MSKIINYLLIVVGIGIAVLWFLAHKAKAAGGIIPAIGALPDKMLHTLPIDKSVAPPVPVPPVKDTSGNPIPTETISPVLVQGIQDYVVNNPTSAPQTFTYNQATGTVTTLAAGGIPNEVPTLVAVGEPVTVPRAYSQTLAQFIAAWPAWMGQPDPLVIAQLQASGAIVG